MANEPRKPRFTDLKKLVYVRKWLITSWLLTLLAGLFLWHPLVYVALVFIIASIGVKAHSDNITVWEAAQWTRERSVIMKAGTYVLTLKRMLDGEPQNKSRLTITALMENGHEVLMSREFFDSLPLGFMIEYDTRVLNGKRECVNPSICK